MNAGNGKEFIALDVDVEQNGILFADLMECSLEWNAKNSIN